MFTHIPSLRTLSFGLAIALVLLAGCFASKYTLIDPATAKVDRAYVGDYDAVNAHGEHSALVIRNVDDKFFFIETRDEGKSDVSRMIGFIANVGGATFAHVRNLNDDGTLPADWTIMRLQLTGENLVIRQLSEDFFKAHPVESAEQLKAVIEKNVADDSMYDSEATVTATKAMK